jgi:hypothetical protein
LLAAWTSPEVRQAIIGLNATNFPKNLSQGEIDQWNGLYGLYAAFAGGTVTTANPFDTRTIADGTHSMTAAVDLADEGALPVKEMRHAPPKPGDADYGLLYVAIGDGGAHNHVTRRQKEIVQPGDEKEPAETKKVCPDEFLMRLERRAQRFVMQDERNLHGSKDNDEHAHHVAR